MRFIETKLAGVMIVEPERHEDERGFFARTWCAEEFRQHGLNPGLSQCSISFNKDRGTLRGMHFQKPPYQEDKLVRCTTGAIYDVALDLREKSSTYSEWVALELSAENRRMFYLPTGIAHGFQTLVDSSEVLYQISQPYVAGSASGVRWNDKAFAIEWPDIATRVMSERDASYSDFSA